MYFFLGHAPKLNRRTDSYAKWLKQRVSAQGSSFWRSGRYAPKAPQNYYDDDDDE